MYRILTDADVEVAGMQVAIDCMEEAFRQHAAGTLISPGRLTSDVEAGRMVFTAGASTVDDPVVGFRYYDLQHLYSDQLTAVFSANDGSLHGVVVGPLLGAVRTGAIGGVAIKYLTRKSVESLGIIGTGYQARTQLAAALAVRSFSAVRVYSRDANRRKEFADFASEKMACKVEPVDSARQATEESDVLICCTTSAMPVVKAGWLKPGVHINNVGPKFTREHELDEEVYERAARFVTDAPAQVEVAGDDFILHGTERAALVEPLSAIVASRFGCADDATESASDISIFISLGLAGTEVLLAKRLLDS